VIFYEDYPYVDTDAYGNSTLNDTLAWLKSRQQPVKPKLSFLSKVDLQAKIDSINAYASQIETLFGNQSETLKSVQRYAIHAGKGQPAECFWTPKLNTP
jgi:hypothetical protein